MIVVAIIGVLVAVAIPNFQRFMARAKQTEAKNNLGAVYGAQKSFHGEWNRFHGMFGVIGFSPEGNLKYRITLLDGTNLPPSHPWGKGTTASDDNVPKTNGANQVSTDAYCDVAGGTASATKSTACVNTLFAKASKTPTAATLTSTAFLAVASSDLDGDADTDDWTISEKKELKNPESDL